MRLLIVLVVVAGPMELVQIGGVEHDTHGRGVNTALEGGHPRLVVDGESTSQGLGQATGGEWRIVTGRK